MNAVQLENTLRGAYYRRRYIRGTREDTPDLFGQRTRWWTVDGYLDRVKVQAALDGRSLYGYFGCYSAPWIAVDVDDHVNAGWNGDEPTARLVRLYAFLRSKLPEPSLLFRTPRGLHAYFLLSYHLPTEYLQARLADLLEHRAEVRPTPGQALRIPRAQDQLHPSTLARAPSLPVDAAAVYHPVTLCDLDDDDAQPERLYRLPKARKETDQRAMSKIEQASTWARGASNGTFTRRAGAYFAAGLPVEEAAARIVTSAHASGYRGELTNGRRVEQRLRSTYRNLERTGRWTGITHYEREPIPQRLGAEAFALHLAEVAAPRFTARKTVAHRRFVAELFHWLDYQDSINLDGTLRADWNHVYPYHAWNWKRGFYPLPGLLLDSWNSHGYLEHLDALEGAGLLTGEKTPYRPRIGDQAGTCRYYGVSLPLLATLTGTPAHQHRTTKAKKPRPLVV